MKDSEIIVPIFKVGDWILSKNPYEGEQERFVYKVDLNAMEYLLYPYLSENFLIGGEWVAIKDQNYYQKVG